MPIWAARSRAPAISERGTLALSAVTAMAWSPSAKCAALATTVLSMPPLKATATLFRLRRISSNRSCLASSSSGMKFLRGKKGLTFYLRRQGERAQARAEFRLSRNGRFRNGQASLSHEAQNFCQVGLSRRFDQRRSPIDEPDRQKSRKPHIEE